MKTEKQVLNCPYLDNYGIGFQELYDFVINKNNCVFCGACASLCPRIYFKEKEPILYEYDPECSMCFYYCARTFFPEEIIEKEIFGSQVCKNYFLGSYKKIIAAKGTNDMIIEVAQNGGVVTSLLIHALKTGLVDGILLTDKDVNLGVMILQMSKFAVHIREEIQKDEQTKRVLRMPEQEIKEHIKELKKEIFKDKIGTIS